MIAACKVIRIGAMASILLHSGALGAAGFPPSPFPREQGPIPVNGTDLTEDPEALREAFNLGRRAANDVFECGDHIAFLDDVKGLETPHTDWAAPFDGPRLRVLVFAGHRGFLRQVMELRQRSEFEFRLAMRPVMYHYARYRHPSIVRHFQERHRRLLADAYDVLLLPADDTLNLLDGETLRLVAERIRAGMPAVFLLNVADWDRAEYKETRALFEAMSPLTFAAGVVSEGAFEADDAPGAPAAGLDWSLWPDAVRVQRAVPREGARAWVRRGDACVVATGRYGAGRVLALAPPALPDGDGTHSLYARGGEPLTDDAYELTHSLILKALLWAAGAEPETALRVPTALTAPAGRTASAMARVVAANPDVDFAALHVKARLKGPWGEELLSCTQALAAVDGAAAASIPLPALSLAGTHRLDLWLMHGDRIVDWAHAAVRAEGGGVLKAEIARAPAGPGEAAVFRVRAEGRRGALHVRAVDGLDRVFFDLRREAGDNDLIAVDTALSLHPFNRVAFELRDGEGRLLGRDVAEFYVPRIGLEALNGQYCVASFGRPSVAPHLFPHLGDLYRAAGFNTVYYPWHSRHRVWETANMGLAGITGLMPPFVKQARFDKELKSCPNDPGVRAEWDRRVDEAKDDIRAYGSVARVIDDECYLAYTGYREGAFEGAQACQCEHCARLFRAEMKKEYGVIARLNDEWGTDYADFEAVRIVEEAAIDALVNPAPWLAFRQFMNRVFAGAYYGRIDERHAALGREFHAGPGAPNYTSAEGGATYRAGDYAALQDAIRFMLAYGGPESAHFPGAFVGQPGAQKYDPPEWWKEWGPWDALLRGADALWFYNGPQIIGGELSWRKHAEWVEQGVHDIVRGAGALVRDAEPLNRDVRVFYAAENLAMGWLFGKRRDAWRGFRLAGGRARSAGVFEGLLRDYLCMQTSLVTAQDIARGELSDCRVLFLPAAFNMDEATAAAIGQWVRNGGRLLADVLPATRTRYGKPRTESLLTDVFGVDASRAEPHMELERWYSVGTEPSPDFCEDALWLPGDTTFLGVEATTAKIYGRMLSRQGNESRTLFINRHGKGEAILLNFVLSGLDAGSSGWFQLFGDALLKRTGLTPAARILNPQTRASLPFRRLHAFRYGEALLLGVIRGRGMKTGGRPLLVDDAAFFGGADDACLAWTGSRHAYDVRGRRYLGYGESATVDVPFAKARLVAALPYRVAAVELALPARWTAGTECAVQARIRTDAAVPGKHLFYLDVVSPTGARIPAYCRTETGVEGRVAFGLPFAWNERPGTWRVRVRDVLSGVEAQGEIVISGATEQ